MSSYISGAASSLSNCAAQFHSYFKTIPVAGPIYTGFTQHIGLPLWNLRCKVKNIAAFYISQTRQVVEPKIRNHPLIASIAVVTLAVFTFKAVFMYNKNVAQRPTSP